MSETQEKVHVVMRRPIGLGAGVPVKAFDDRSDAREYAGRMRKTAKRYRYSVVSVRKG